MTEPDPTPSSDEAPVATLPVATLPPDPAAYDSARNVQARARGLPVAYIAGGTDPDPGPALREERYYGRLLLGMVVIVILGGFIVGAVLALIKSGA